MNQKITPLRRHAYGIALRLRLAFSGIYIANFIKRAANTQTHVRSPKYSAGCLDYSISFFSSLRRGHMIFL